MKVKLIIFLILFLLSIQSFGQSKTIDPKDLIGTYSFGFDFGFNSLTLKSDLTYEMESSDCTTQIREYGTYFLDSGVLQFSESSSANDSSENKSENTFKLLPINWGDRIYLLPDGYLELFCNAINFGVEPRSDLFSSPYAGGFYIRNGDERKSVGGLLPDIPSKYKVLLLEKPVGGRVFKKEYKDGRYIVTINKGSKDGLKVGIQLIGENHTSFVLVGFDVISVEKNSSLVVIDDKVKVGDKLSSKFNFENYYR